MSYSIIAYPIDNNIKPMYIHLMKVTNKKPILLKYINKNLKYLTPFKCIVKKNRLVIYNKDDINYFSYTHRLKTKIYIVSENKTINKIIKFHTPILYNIATKTEFFSYNIKPVVYYKPVICSINRIFIVLPCIDPILRGQIMDNCMKYVKKNNPLFIVIGDIHGVNKIKTCVLMTRYLLSIGIKREYIYKSPYDKDLDCILEAIHMIDFILMNNKFDLFIACQSRIIVNVLNFIRKNKLHNPKIQMICE